MAADSQSSPAPPTVLGDWTQSALRDVWFGYPEPVQNALQAGIEPPDLDKPMSIGFISLEGHDKVLVVPRAPSREQAAAWGASTYARLLDHDREIVRGFYLDRLERNGRGVDKARARLARWRGEPSEPLATILEQGLQRRMDSRLGAR